MPISVSNGLGKLVSANLTPNQRNIEESIQKLSTGIRIHKGADDAASMHLASRFESHVKGLTVTISNQKDALAALYTAEGGINKIGNLLQNMRELAVQSQTDTIDNLQRELLVAKSDAIKLEITRIALNTKFGDTKLLDGTYQNKSIQVGKNSFDTLDISIGSVAGIDMVFVRDDLTQRVYTTPYIIGQTETSLQTSNKNKIEANTIFIDGHQDNANIVIDAGMQASQFATRVHAAGLGIDASAVTKAQLFGMAQASDISFRLGANSANSSDASGVTISATITDPNDLEPLVTAVNLKTAQTGVTAEISIINGSADSSAITLTDDNGDDIFISHMDFTPDGPSHSNNAASNQNEIFARSLDKDGVQADIANTNLTRGIGTDEIVRFIDKDRNIHVDQAEGVVSVTVTDKGSGYASAPTVTFSGGNFSQDASGATGAIANYSANLVNGKVDTITRATLADRGRGYDQTPTITIPAPPVQNFNARTSINITNDRITLNSHNFETGDPLTYGRNGGTTLTGLIDGNEYFAIKHDNNTISLASTKANALANNSLDLEPASHSFNARSNTSVSNDTIQVSNHNFANGDTVTYTSGGRTLRNFTDGQDYIVRNVSGSTFKLEDTTSGNTINIVGMQDSFNAQNDVNHTTNRISVSGNDFVNNDKVTYSSGGGLAIGGLVDGQDYYVRSISGDTIQLSATSFGSAIDIIARETGSFNADSGVDLSADTITAPGHSLSDGNQVTYTTNSGGTAIRGLTPGQTYFVRNVLGNTFQVSETLAGSIVDLQPEQSSFNAATQVSGINISTTHKFSSGDIVTYSAGSGTAIGGLVDGNEYRIINVSGSTFNLEDSISGGGPISLTAGASETHTLTGRNSGSSETHSFNGAYAGENETHTFTNEYAGPSSESHSFKSTQYAGHDTTQTFQGRTATATPVMGEDDVPDPVYYNDITQDYERAALIVGTVTMESPKIIRIASDNPTEKAGFFGTAYNYTDGEGVSMGNSDVRTVDPIKTVNDVDISTITSARKSLDYIDAGIDQFIKVGNEISINASRISSAITSTLNNMIHAEGEFSSLLSTDYAIETTTFTVSSMIKETSLALLAQANAPKKAVNTLISNVMENDWDPTFFLVQGGGYRYRNI